MLHLSGIGRSAPVFSRANIAAYSIAASLARAEAVIDTDVGAWEKSAGPASRRFGAAARQVFRRRGTLELMDKRASLIMRLIVTAVVIYFIVRVVMGTSAAH